MVRKPDATMQPAPQANHLMPKHRVLSLKPQLRLEWRGQDGHNETEQPHHSASLGDSITSSTRMRFSVHTGTADARAAHVARRVEERGRKGCRCVQGVLWRVVCDGEVDWTGRISKCGDAMLRSYLFEAAG